LGRETVVRWSCVAWALSVASCGGGGFSSPTGAATPPPESISVSIDLSADRHPISPDIYGVTLWYDYNWVGDTTVRDMAFARDVRLPVNRHGGNGTSRYNWLVDSSNAAADWYFMGGSTRAGAPGQMVDTIVRKNRANGVKTVVTVPTIPWINASSTVTCSFPVSIYGPQQQVNPYDRPAGDQCGNGLRPDGSRIPNTDPERNHIRNSPDFQRRWVRHLVATHGSAADGGVAVYELDNEPGLWMETHRDVHPLPLGYHEQIEYTIAYALAIKSADPTAAVLGPTDINWDDCWKCPTDGSRDNGNTPLGLWYLRQMAAAEATYGVRLLDYFSEHYPGQNATSPVLRAVDNIRLWRRWIAEGYPGTRLAIDEYSWTNDPKGFREGLLVAEGLGAFGREGVDLASYWPSPDWNADATTPAALAFRLYRSYDGAGSAFGETSVRATSSNEARLAVFAAERSADAALTVVAVNRSAGVVEARFQAPGAPGGARAAAYRLSEANPRGISRVDDVVVAGGSFSASLPAASATLIVLGSR
jgi:hypothetical protein